MSDIEQLHAFLVLDKAFMDYKNRTQLAMQAEADSATGTAKIPKRPTILRRFNFDE